MPTFAELAQTEAPRNTDGISFLPELLNKEQVKHEHLYWEIQEGRGVKGFKQATRFGKWKALRQFDNYHTELYNLEDDINETNDVSAQYLELVEKANKILKTESVKIEHYQYSGGVFKK
jgi:arylsulfatase A-like enzyme